MNGSGWGPLVKAGQFENLKDDREYLLQVRLAGQELKLVIAEITPVTANVFYENGYAHALGKPTILLARRDAVLPFDIQSFRVVFYNDSIGGKVEVERNLRKHLDEIAGR